MGFGEGRTLSAIITPMGPPIVFGEGCTLSTTIIPIFATNGIW